MLTFSWNMAITGVKLCASGDIKCNLMQLRLLGNTDTLLISVSPMVEGYKIAREIKSGVTFSD